MKRLILFLFVILTTSLFAQKIDFVFDGTVANSATKTVYVQINNQDFMRLDSIQVVFTATGEIDLDKLICTKGNINSKTGAYSSIFTASSTPDTTALSVDNAAGVTTLVSYKASTVGLTALAPYDVIRISIEAGSSGNDATDPNKLLVRIIKYYTYLK